MSQLLYNFDRASQEPFVIVVEGVTDVWRIGHPAVAIFGHDVSAAQMQLLTRFSDRQRPVLLILDGTEQQRIQRYARELQELGVPVLPVFLPGELDPGDCDLAELCQLIDYQARQAGIPLDRHRLFSSSALRT